MLRALSNYMKGIPSVYVDGSLYCGIALFGYLQTYLTGDDAAKYVAAQTLFWINCVNGACLALCTCLKMFRSSAFTDHQKQKSIDAGNTTVVSRTTNTQP